MIKVFPYHKQQTASNLSIDYLGKHVLWSQCSLVTGKEGKALSNYYMRYKTSLL
jgi:hypothetical protein